MYLDARLMEESSRRRQLEPESTTVVEPRSAPAGPKAAESASEGLRATRGQGSALRRL